MGSNIVYYNWQTNSTDNYLTDFAYDFLVYVWA